MSEHTAEKDAPPRWAFWHRVWGWIPVGPAVNLTTAPLITRVLPMPEDFVALCAGPVDGDFCRLDNGHPGGCCPIPHADPERWWISDGDVAYGGEKILGPFGSRDLALEVRRLFEAHPDAGGLTFWVSQERLLSPRPGDTDDAGRAGGMIDTYEGDIR